MCHDDSSTRACVMACSSACVRVIQRGHLHLYAQAHTVCVCGRDDAEGKGWRVYSKGYINVYSKGYTPSSLVALHVCVVVTVT